MSEPDQPDAPFLENDADLDKIVLAALAGDRLEVLHQLIRDQGLNEYVRWEGAQAYLLLVRDGRLTRLEAVQRLQQHLREAIQRDDYPGSRKSLDQRSSNWCTRDHT